MKRLTEKILLTVLVQLCFITISYSQIPKEYKGKPFFDSLHTTGAQEIPGRVELALYDLGGEGISYHDTDSTNNGSGVLNRQKLHERPGVPMYICHFREKEGVDISYTKDSADFNHPNMVVPTVNQLYIGWEADSEWTNYTVYVKKAGKYKITTLYGYKDNKSSLYVNNIKAADIVLPVNTGNWHYWNKAEVGTIVFPETGLNLLTLCYNAGANLAYFDFEFIEELSRRKMKMEKSNERIILLIQKMEEC
jgi:hypothetical protein